MVRRIQDFTQVADVSTTDLLLVARNGITMNAAASQFSDLLNQSIQFDQLNGVDIVGAQDNEYLRYDGNTGDWVATSIPIVDTSVILQVVSVLTDTVTSVSAVVSNQTLAIASIDTRLTNTSAALRSDITSVDNALAATSAQLRTDITSATNFLQAAITSVDSHVNVVSNATSVVSDRITSVNTYFLNQTSVTNARVTSVQTVLNATSAALRIDITSVYNSVPRKMVSLADTSLATGSGTNGYAVTWDNTQAQFVLKPGSGGGSGTVTSIGFTQPAAGLAISGTNPITTQGQITYTLANDLSALEGLSSTGFGVRTGTDTWAQRTITTSVAGNLTITNGNGVAGNPVLDIGTNVVTLTGSQALTNKSVNGVTLTTGGSTSNYLGADGTYHTLSAPGTGDVVGPASATDTAIARFNTTTGKLIENSVVLLDSSGGLSNVGSMTIQNGAGIRPVDTNGFSFSLIGLDPSGPSLSHMFTVTNGTPVTADLSSSVTIGSKYIYRVGGTDVAVADGGTGVSTLTGIVKGNGTSAFTAATAGTDYQAPITLTTTGTSGAATFLSNTLNIPNYANTTYTAGTGLTLTGTAFSVNASQNITTLSNLTGNGSVMTTGGTGALSVVPNTGTGNNVLATSPTFSGATIFSSSVNGVTLTATGSATQYLNGAGNYVTISGSGTVTSVSVVSANGFTGTVANATSTPAITLTTSITGILQGNGTAISAATTTGSGSVVLGTSPSISGATLTTSTVNGVTLTTGGTATTFLDGVGSYVAIQSASTSQAGIITQATTAQVTAETASVFPDAASLKYHQGIAKAWVNFNGTGTVAINDSYNVSSVSDGGVGIYGMNLSITMANANYCTLAIAGTSSAGVSDCQVNSVSTTAVSIYTRQINASSVTFLDNTVNCIAIFGDI